MSPPDGSGVLPEVSADPVDAGPLLEAIARKRRIEPPSRRTFDKVRRNSRRNPENQSPLTYAQAGRLIRALQRWERGQDRKARSRIRCVGYVGLDVFGYLARQAVESGGRLEAFAYSRIAAACGYSRSAVIAAIARLKAAGWLDWRRTFVETGRAGVRGPQVEQGINAYWLLLPVKALAKLGVRLWGPEPPDDTHRRHAEETERESRRRDDLDHPLFRGLAQLERAWRERESSKRSDSQITDDLKGVGLASDNIIPA